MSSEATKNILAAIKGTMFMFPSEGCPANPCALEHHIFVTLEGFNHQESVESIRCPLQGSSTVLSRRMQHLQWVVLSSTEPFHPRKDNNRDGGISKRSRVAACGGAYCRFALGSSTIDHRQGQGGGEGRGSKFNVLAITGT